MKRLRSVLTYTAAFLYALLTYPTLEYTILYVQYLHGLSSVYYEAAEYLVSYLTVLFWSPMTARSNL